MFPHNNELSDRVNAPLQLDLFGESLRYIFSTRHTHLGFKIARMFLWCWTKCNFWYWFLDTGFDCRALESTNLLEIKCYKTISLDLCLILTWMIKFGGISWAMHNTIFKYMCILKVVTILVICFCMSVHIYLKVICVIQRLICVCNFLGWKNENIAVG